VKVKSPQENSTGMAEIMVDARDPGLASGGSEPYLNGYSMDANVIDPQGASQAVTLHQVAPGRYSGSFKSSATGAYLLRITGAPPDSSHRPVSDSIGWVLAYSPEYSQLQPDPDALLRLAAAANTPRNPFVDPEQVFIHNLVAPHAAQPAWPWLLLLAALLLPVDIAVRRLLITRSDFVRFWNAVTRRGLAKPLEQKPFRAERLEGLFQAKKEAGQRNKPVGQEGSPGLVIHKEKLQATVKEESSPESKPSLPEEKPSPEGSASSVSQLLKSKRDRENH
jgi:hypothetical protein